MPINRGWRRIVCVAGGPSFAFDDYAQRTLIEGARALGWYVIVVNSSWKDVRSADVLFGADAKFWHQAIKQDDVRSHFRGEMWTTDRPSAERYGLRLVLKYATPKYNGVEDAQVYARRAFGLSPDPDRITTLGNGGACALSLARCFGAELVALVGYDMQQTNGRGHHHAEHPLPLSNPTPQALALWAERFQFLARDLAAAGVRVVNCSRETALTCFPRADLEETLAG